MTDEGTNIFAGNIVDYIRHFILKGFWNEVACNDGHFEDQNRSIDKGSPENSSENKDSNLEKKQDLNLLSVVKNLRFKNVSKTIIGQININSISSKLNQLKELVLKHVVLVVCETNLDETFPISQFHMDGFSLPYRLDRNRNGGGVMIFVKEFIPSKLLTKHNFPSDVEGLFVELNFRKSKWLFFGTSLPPAQNDQYFFNCIDKALDTYGNYDNVLLAENRRWRALLE